MKVMLKYEYRDTYRDALAVIICVTRLSAANLAVLSALEVFMSISVKQMGVIGVEFIKNG